MASLIRTCIWINIIPCLLCKWLSSTSTLPKADYGSAVGAYDGKIYILGGYANPHQVTEYHIDTDTFTEEDDHNTLLTTPIFESCQFWTQREDTLYMLSSSSSSSISTIASFNMMTRAFSSSFMPDISHIIHPYSCLTSSQHHLFVLGGYDTATYLPTNTLQAFSFMSNTWIKRAPFMKTARMHPICAINNHYLWALGGMHSTNDILSTERISITDSAAIEWKNDTPLLIHPVLYARAVSYQHYIYIIGGRNKEHLLNTVQMIDTIDKTVSVSSDILPFAVESTASIVYDESLYLFGGRTAIHPIVSANTLLYKHLENKKVAKRSASFVSLEARAAGDTTSNPSVTPTNGPVAQTAEPTKKKTDGDNNSANSGGLFDGVDDTILILTAVCLALLVILLSLLLGFVCWKRKRDEALNQELEEQYLQNIALELHQKEMAENAVKAASAEENQMDEDEVLQQVLALSALEQQQKDGAKVRSNTYQQVNDEETTSVTSASAQNDAAAAAVSGTVDNNVAKMDNNNNNDNDSGDKDDDDDNNRDKEKEDDDDEDIMSDGDLMETGTDVGIADDYKQDVEDAMDRPQAASVVQMNDAAINMLIGGGDDAIPAVIDEFENAEDGNSDSDDDVLIGVEDALPTTSGAGE